MIPGMEYEDGCPVCREHVARCKCDADYARVTCPNCRGHGAEPLSDNLNWLPCGRCHGTGKVPNTHADHVTEGKP